MKPSSEQPSSGSRGRFPSTHWSKLAQVRNGDDSTRLEALSFLAERYWKPVYSYLRCRGYKREDAQDLTQGFLLSWIQKEVFGQANAARGRFRSFLLSSLKNFVANAHRRDRAKRRYPQGGLLSLEELTKHGAYEPIEQETPEDAFNRVWISSLLLRVLKALEQEARETNKGVHYKLFLRRVIEPALEGRAAPSLRDLAQSLGLTEREASNRIITARRAFQRLLREEIRSYALSEADVASEVRDLFHFLSTT